LAENICLITPRQNKKEFGALVTSHIGTHKTVAAYDINYYFPLYLYSDSEKITLFNRLDEYKKRSPNINLKIFKVLEQTYETSVSPEKILHFMYAILYSNTYRAKYSEFLKLDFPRLPFTKDYDLFGKMAQFGERLVELHLLQSGELDVSLVRSQGKGNNIVEKLKYHAKEKRVYYNAVQYFEGIAGEIWEYHIGGYQICEKWLKDRKEKVLSASDIRHYCRICNAIHKTIEIQKEIDAVYPKVEIDVIDF
jgi:predicted helicase